MAFLRTRYVLVLSLTLTLKAILLLIITSSMVVIDGKHPGCDEYYFGRREFSFTLENDVYLRYKSFKSVSSLEHAIKSCFPYKIDIGAVYSVDVSPLLLLLLHQLCAFSNHFWFEFSFTLAAWQEACLFTNWHQCVHSCGEGVGLWYRQFSIFFSKEIFFVLMFIFLYFDSNCIVCFFSRI